MVDITMCRDEDCPMKDKCFRYTAIPDVLRQSYFFGSPRSCKETNVCDSFLGVRKSKGKNK